MKHLLRLLAFLILLPLGLKAQTLPTDETGKISFTEVVDVPNTSKSELYTKAKLWIAESFRSSSAVTQFDSDSLIIVRGTRPVIIANKYAANTANLRFTQKYYFKDGKYKFVTTDFSPDGSIIYDKQNFISPENYPIKMKLVRESYASYYKGAVEAMNDIHNSFKVGFSKLISSKNDW
ncbi:DUF4468 domain-containing protein [Adhaeribacter aquaticus]|uniref:DUF4468 domain-containing protein n=1 Tax=Adhaeribacter aquaticus TaxID=299567 RepID=UPI0003F532DF|nr:DUF4468 domain-containing protein [Adhaeribacter aquaticus]